MLTDDFHGMPKWVWVAGIGAVILALVLARRTAPATDSTGTPTQPADASGAVAADASTAQANVAAKASTLQALLAGIFGLEATRSSNDAAVRSNLAQAATARDAARYDYLKAQLTAPTTTTTAPAAHTFSGYRPAGANSDARLAAFTAARRPDWAERFSATGQGAAALALKIGLHV